MLADIFAFVGMNRQISVPDDPHSTFFNDGQRDVALRLARLLGLPPVQILGAAEAGMRQASNTDAAHAFLFERRAAYRRAFDGKEGLWVLHDILQPAVWGCRSPNPAMPFPPTSTMAGGAWHFASSRSST